MTRRRLLSSEAGFVAALPDAYLCRLLEPKVCGVELKALADSRLHAQPEP
jgi:hypothetical protein